MSLHITSTTKSVRLIPTTKDELQSIIKQELKYQDPDADLNFIDTSLIIDMSSLFWYLNVGNIKIDEWDTSNVTDMAQMFSGCPKFNADLSSWDVSNVYQMYCLFENCFKFCSDLSGWGVSKVSTRFNMFNNCRAMKYGKQHKFSRRH